MAKCYSIGPLTGSLKPKYRVISNVLGDDFDSSKGVDIFIDLNTLVSTLGSSQKFQRSLPFAEDVEAELISGILMILKHWKDYSRKWENARIFLIVNDFDMGALCEQSILKSYLVPYVHKFGNEKYKQFVYYWTEAIKRVEIILKYIPGSYLIRCKRFDSYVIPNVIDDYEHNERRRIIISGNSLMTNYHYMKNCYVMYSRYKSTGMCQLSDPLMIVQSITKIDDDIMIAFIKNKVFYNLLNTIVGDFDRGIIGLTQLGISRFAADLLRAVEKREIPDKPKSIESVFPAIDKVYHEYLRQTYPLVDIPLHSDLVTMSQIEKIKSELVDLYDIDSLRALSINGLNLLELM